MNDPEFTCDSCAVEYIGEPHNRGGAFICDECKCEPLFTRREIADFLAGWQHGRREDFSVAVRNALVALKCEHDGIEAVRRRGRR